MINFWTQSWFHTSMNVLFILGGSLFLGLGLNFILNTIAKAANIEMERLISVKRILRWLVILACFFAIIATLGWNLEGLWTFFTTVFALLAIGFIAVWSVLSNFVCAFLIRWLKPFLVNDWVEFPGEEVQSKVTDLALTFTTLENLEGDLFKVPNNQFFQKSIIVRPQ